MKKLMLFMALCVMTMSACANDKAIPYEKVPKAGRDLIAKYFPKYQPAFCKMDKDLTETRYDVIFTNGSSIEFDGKGNWTEIKCKLDTVPQALVPTQIINYLDQTHPGVVVKKIEKNKKGYDVDLSNRVEIKFDKNFNVVDYDD